MSVSDFGQIQNGKWYGLTFDRMNNKGIKNKYKSLAKQQTQWTK